MAARRPMLWPCRRTSCCWGRSSSRPATARAWSASGTWGTSCRSRSPRAAASRNTWEFSTANDMRPVQLIRRPADFVEGEKAVEYPLLQATLTQRYTQRAIEFVERNRTQPFFLYLAHAMPHKPLAASEAFSKKSGAGETASGAAAIKQPVIFLPNMFLPPFRPAQVRRRWQKDRVAE